MESLTDGIGACTLVGGCTVAEPSVRAVRIRAISPGEKYSFASSHSWIKLRSFFWCFGQLSKAAAEATNTGRWASQISPNFLFPSFAMT